MRIVVAAMALSGGGGAGSGGATGTSPGSHSAAATAADTTTATATAAATATETSSPATATATAPASAASTTSDSGGASVGRPGNQCVASGLVLSFLGGQGATGHGELGFALRNTGPACRTGGYPGIQFLDQSGAALPTTPTHTTADFFGHLSLRELAVAPGQSVSFRLGVSHGGGGGSAGCTTAYGLQVIAPNDTATLHVQIPNGASECGTATISPVQPGDSAYP
jgi:hypothetical protein